VGKPANNEFDPKAFLAKVGAGKTILKLAKNKHVFEHLPEKRFPVTVAAVGQAEFAPGRHLRS
jgi:hypothetical protein